MSITPLQDLHHYLPQNSDAIIPHPADCTTQYMTHYFSPWTQQARILSNEEIQQILTDIIARHTRHPGYALTRKKHDPKWIASIAQLAQLDAFPNVSRPGIAITDTDARLLPTAVPSFKDIYSEWDGYPFDDLQESYLTTGTPLRILHITQDHAWYLVLTASFWGWVKAECVAFVSEEIMQIYQTAHYVVSLKDQIVPTLYIGQKMDPDKGRKIRSHREQTFEKMHVFIEPTWKYLRRVCGDASESFFTWFLSNAKAPTEDIIALPVALRIGNIYPMSASKLHDHIAARSIYIPGVDAHRNAMLYRRIIRSDHLSPFPYPLTLKNIADIAQEMIGDPYGWGGLCGYRDCSSTLADLMSTFGLWLPRNAKEQISAGPSINLAHLTPAEKLLTITQNAKSFLTLLYMPGHIVLYLGEKEGVHYIYHSTSRCYGTVITPLDIQLQGRTKTLLEEIQLIRML